ncbi:MAG: RNA polymerase sigma factor [Chloroflexi bacterium]|nr:RNA polymerase sigma factor [Chloroflexota bacterium]
MTQLTYIVGHVNISGALRPGLDGDNHPIIDEVAGATSDPAPNLNPDLPATSGADLAEQVSSLFEAYAQPVCAYIHSLVGDWPLAHDLTQETFLRLYDTRARLAQVSNARAWVYRIATHVALNERKRRKRFAWLPWHDADQSGPTTAWSPVESEFAARDAVERALAALPQDYRAPLLLYSGYDFSVREIAEALELSESAVKTRLHRAREMFRKVYDGSEQL